MRQAHYLVIDTETGGLNPREHSLLSIAGVLWFPDLKEEDNFIPAFDLIVKEPKLSITTQALNVNKFDVNRIYKEGLTPDEAIDKIKTNLRNLGISKKTTIAGHNINFDVSFIKRMFWLANRLDEYDTVFKNKPLDTCSILEYLLLQHKIDIRNVSGDEMFKLCGVKINQSERHTAMGDALATAKCLDHLVNSKY